MSIKTGQVKTKCICEKKSTGTCSNCSRVKMSILLKNGFNHLKYKSASGGLTNPIWYNYYSKNKENITKIISDMLYRFKKCKNQELKSAANILIFYDNETKQEIKRVKC